MTRIKKTDPEVENREKDEEFLKLTPEQRLRIMYEINERFRDPTVNYILKGSLVKISKG